MRGLRMGFAVVLTLAATQAVARRSAQAAFAEPADIIAAESNFIHLSTAKGAKAAIRATAVSDAQIFAPQLMRVTEYANSADIKIPAQWHTRELWMSCDGSIAVTHGEWQRSPASGWYVTIWQRQKSGSYKWILAADGVLHSPLPDTDMITAGIADCPVRHAHSIVETGKTDASARGKPAVSDYLSGHSDDTTLEWATSPAPDGSPGFVLRLKKDGLMREVLHAGAAPGA